MSLLSMIDREMSDDAVVGMRVELLMTVRRVTQTALAARLGLGQSGVSKKIRGMSAWSVRDLKVTATELGTTVSYLVGETEDPTPPDLDDAGSPVSDSNRRPPLYIVDGSALEYAWPAEAPKRKTA